MKVRCNTCKQYVERDEALRVAVMSFCDSECFGKYQRKASKKKPKKSPMPSDVRARVLTRDRQQCALCAARSSLHVHHVKYLSEGGKHVTGNLITLCEEHHALVHSKKSIYQPMCLKIIAERERVVELVREKEALCTCFGEHSDGVCPGPYLPVEAFG